MFQAPPLSHACGLFYIRDHVRTYVPQAKLAAHTTILSSVARTTLTQTFENTGSENTWKETKYDFPLVDGVSVVAFRCTIGDKVIKGVVKEKQKARQVYEEARDRGDAAALLEQSPDAADVFSTSVGNVPPKTTVHVEITYLGELKHDAEVDGIRFTIPTVISPRYGDLPHFIRSNTAKLDTTGQGGLEIVVDVKMSAGSVIKSIQSPSHPISVSVGTLSTAPDAESSLQKASAGLSLRSAELAKDFVLHVVATKTSEPVALLETHPTLHNERALMATLVPKFALPPERPEIVFVCDRSGSMQYNDRIGNLKVALRIFLKSLPVAVKFNICSFGSSHSLLWEKSRTYDKASLEEAMQHIETFAADMGGTEMHSAMKDVFKRKLQDMNLEVLLITDGDIWDQSALFEVIRESRRESKGGIRLFTLGIGTGASSALIDGAARAGGGFSQQVGDNEKMNNKVVRMLKAALTPHINDYTLEVKYEAGEDADGDDDFELVEKVVDCLVINDDATQSDKDVPPENIKKTTSLFDPSVDVDTEMGNTGTVDNKHDHLPSITPPKILQAPFQIPPLYPFNRTSVYLLMSGETAQKPVKSVVLRGTSRHGPLELEIPVTTLDEPGETVHQLAARKAVKELEEGEGWIYHAKDPSQKLLKEKHEGCFSDMVEREAVRLGVKYSVGGKWCSFVAVEETSDAESGKKARVIGLDAAPPAPVLEEAQSQTGPSSFGLHQPQLMMAAHAPLPQSPSSPVAFAMFSQPQKPMARASRMSTRGGTFSARNMAMMATPGGSIDALGGHANSGREFMTRRSKGASAAVIKKETEEAEEEAEEEAALEVPSDPLEAIVSGVPSDPLEPIVFLQGFDGSWPSSEDIFRVIGADQGMIEEALRARGGVWGEKLARAEGDAIATAGVLAFLKARRAGDGEMWELIGDKGWEWLVGVVRELEGKREELEECLRALF